MEFVNIHKVFHKVMKNKKHSLFLFSILRIYDIQRILKHNFNGCELHFLFFLLETLLSYDMLLLYRALSSALSTIRDSRPLASVIRASKRRQERTAEVVLVVPWPFHLFRLVARIRYMKSESLCPGDSRLSGDKIAVAVGSEVGRAVIRKYACVCCMTTWCVKPRCSRRSVGRERLKRVQWSSFPHSACSLLLSGRLFSKLLFLATMLCKAL